MQITKTATVTVDIDEQDVLLALENIDIVTLLYLLRQMTKHLMAHEKLDELKKHYAAALKPLVDDLAKFIKDAL